MKRTGHLSSESKKMLKILGEKAATLGVDRDFFCSGKAAATGHAHADISGYGA